MGCKHKYLWNNLVGQETQSLTKIDLSIKSIKIQWGEHKHLETG